MEITYLLPVTSQPRYHKRIYGLEKEGAQTTILSFERDYFQGNTESLTFESLGVVKSGRYFGRWPKMLAAVPTIRRRAKTSDVVYCFGFYVLVVGWLATRLLGNQCKLVYELGDIRKEFTSRSIASRILRFFERRLLRRTDLIVVTGDRMATEYLIGKQTTPPEKVVVIENKLFADSLVPPATGAQDVTGDQITIGYFGVLRCKRSWEILKKVVALGGGRIKLEVRGFPLELDHLIEDAQSSSHIHFGGPYVFPDDLAEMYANVDVVWACYPYYPIDQPGNWQWARTNRYYESMFFKKPVIVQEGGGDWSSVVQYGVGKVVDMTFVDSAAKEVVSITKDQIAEWARNLDSVPFDDYCYTGEHKDLMARLDGLATM